MHPIRKQRLYVVLSILLGTAVAAFLVFKGLSENINLFYSPSDLKKEKISVDNQIRVGGMVKKDSINKENNSLNSDNWLSIVDMLFIKLSMNLFFDRYNF